MGIPEGSLSNRVSLIPKVTNNIFSRNKNNSNYINNNPSAITKI